MIVSLSVAQLFNHLIIDYSPSGSGSVGLGFMARVKNSHTKIVGRFSSSLNCFYFMSLQPQKPFQKNKIKVIKSLSDNKCAQQYILIEI